MDFFKNQRSLLCLLCFLLIISGDFARATNFNDSTSFVLSGKVVSSETQLGIEAVNIQVNQTRRGTITDANGEFGIELRGGETLHFSSVGYVSTDRLITVGQSRMEVELEPSTTRLDELVIIGFGERERRDVTGSISDMSSKEINHTYAFSVESAMRGQMPGVLVTEQSGNIHDRPRVLIRGMNTWGVTDPLYVIDGVPVAQYGKGAERTTAEGRFWGIPNPQNGYVDILSLINPADIASISVLKDASAAAIYGVRASNGVILITTKQGRSKKPTFSFNIQSGVTFQPDLPELLDVEQYVELVSEEYTNVGMQDTLPNEFRPESSEYLGNQPTTNWLDEVYREYAKRMDVNLSVSSGGELTDYYISLGYSNREGAIIMPQICFAVYTFIESRP
jgi:TonB-dependent SusC/RagA subfamily outer membrane receptor